ncbi:hypothetical protein [Micromonospora palythoicola]|uniref:hypothetical protein n=1 Tax=Micromonospora palythoicola TaxID=3120507 RepID=UPI002FCE2767
MCTIRLARNPSRPAVDSSRPFGAQLRMSWWNDASLLILAVVNIGTVLLVWLRERRTRTGE